MAAAQEVQRRIQDAFPVKKITAAFIKGAKEFELQAKAESAPVGFEFRLEKRIKGLETTESAREWKIAPKLLAFATGAALIIIAGTVYHQAYNGGQQPGLSSLPAGGQSSVLAEAATDSTAADSLKMLESRTGPWNLETVSAGR